MAKHPEHAPKHEPPAAHPHAKPHAAPPETPPEVPEVPETVAPPEPPTTEPAVPAVPAVPVVKAPLPPGMKRARVSVPGTHVGDVEVFYDATDKNPTQAAIDAAKAKLGIVTFGAGPQVEFLD